MNYYLHDFEDTEPVVFRFTQFFFLTQIHGTFMFTQLIEAITENEDVEQFSSLPTRTNRNMRTTRTCD